MAVTIHVIIIDLNAVRPIGQTLFPELDAFFFFNDPATPEIYPLSLHAALPISIGREGTSLVAIASGPSQRPRTRPPAGPHVAGAGGQPPGRSASITKMIRRHADVDERRTVRSEEHTSELQSLAYLVCRLLLEKK